MDERMRQIEMLEKRSQKSSVNQTQIGERFLSIFINSLKQFFNIISFLKQLANANSNRLLIYLILLSIKKDAILSNQVKRTN